MRMFYADKTMRPREEDYAAPSVGFYLLVCALGGLTGVILVLLDAPLWAFYVSPLLLAPVLIHELHVLDAREESELDGEPKFRRRGPLPVPGGGSSAGNRRR